ncbi:WhiB family transcriptional regulator [Aeromicrobium sp. CTD01-1L150]|uniref:WhiB family transcriptional regulator n=1 Tax=Aeromicrobium sp. CTD01-1L150 TaxID=3341830 RepID=UPI0035BF27A0
MTTMTDPSVLTSHGVTVAFAHPAPATGRWACENLDPDLFFPSDDATLADALAVCAGCPMRQTCLELGEARAESGVWGGALLANGRHLERVPVRGRPKKVRAA